MNEAVIFDVDGTLADCQHRRHYVEQEPKNWTAFLDPELVILDAPIAPVVRLAQQLAVRNHILVVSARNERHRTVTSRWLELQEIPYERLYLRADDDYRPDHVVKAEILASIREDFEPWLVVDDRSSVVKMWRERGLLTLQCAEGEF